MPNQFTFRLPDWRTANRTMPTALYVQDTWTAASSRCRARSATTRPGAGPRPKATAPETAPFNAAPITFERTPASTPINDISPRGGAAYDVFGNGKTAVKFNLGRYLAPATNDDPYTQNNPASRIVDIASRSWPDANSNYVVDCDILNPAAQAVPVATRAAR